MRKANTFFMIDVVVNMFQSQKRYHTSCKGCISRQIGKGSRYLPDNRIAEIQIVAFPYVIYSVQSLQLSIWPIILSDPIK